MAGMVPTLSGKSTGRKQWTLHDGPKGSLQRLRNQLAEDGCPESQVVLAKQLLEETCELDFDKNENARIAVYWLIKSSEQGNEEATNLLQKCFHTGKGINEHNYLDVKSCIDMTQDEKLARKAAREMFSSLSNGEDFITSDQLQKRMIEIYEKDKRKLGADANVNRSVDTRQNSEAKNGNLVNNNKTTSRKEIDWSKRVETENRKLTEENLVTAAVNYTHGELPISNQILCLTTPNPKSLDHVPYLHRSIFYPILNCKLLYYRVIRFFSNIPYLSFIPIAKSHFQFLVLCLIYSLIGTDNIILFIPMVFYYLSFSVMVITTFQTMQVRFDYRDFRIWSGLFLEYSGGSLNAEEAEFQFIRNNLKPFGRYFLALLINLIIYPIISDQWIPQSEITVVAFCLTFLSMVAFMRNDKFNYPDLFLLFSFGINVLARYPYESDAVVTQGWRFLDLKIPSFAGYVIGNGIEFCLNFRVLFFLVIPACFVKISMRENGRGIYKYLIPHCLTLSWLQIIIISSKEATMFGLLRGTLALVGMVLFLPLAGLATFVLPILAMANYVYESDYFMSLIFMTSFGVCVVASSWILSRTKFSTYLTYLQLSWAAVAITILLITLHLYPHKITESNANPFKSYNIQKSVKFLPWEKYQNNCHQSSWEQTSIAATQIKCSNLEGTQVRWNGYISSIQLKSINNNLKTIIDKFPNFIKEKLYCTFGEETINNGSIDSLNYYYPKCNLQNWDKFKLSITVKLVSGVWGKTADLILIGDNRFRNFTEQLRVHDKVWFRGMLTNEFNENGEGLIGGVIPHLKLLEIGCSICSNIDLSSFKGDDEEYLIRLNVIVNYLFVVVKCVLNFLLNPIVLFK